LDIGVWDFELHAQKSLLNGRKFEIVEQSGHPFFRRPDLSITDKSLDPRKSDGWMKGIELRRMAEDEDRMAKSVQLIDGSSNASIGEYPQSPSTPNGKVPEGRSHGQRWEFLDVTMMGGQNVRDGRSKGNPDQSEWGDTRIIEESTLN
jgi:hypothetical protein